jgi:hypothetical protein
MSQDDTPDANLALQIKKTRSFARAGGIGCYCQPTAITLEISGGNRLIKQSFKIVDQTTIYRWSFRMGVKKLNE